VGHRRGTVAVLSLLLVFPPARDLFRFDISGAARLLLAAGAGALSVVWFDAYKVIARRRTVVGAR